MLLRQPRSLINQGANVNDKSNGGLTPLHLAAWNNAFATAEVLINQGANVNDKENNGVTPLYVAVLMDASATAEVLRRYGAR